jgi:hypothetical protein
VDRQKVLTNAGKIPLYILTHFVMFLLMRSKAMRLSAAKTAVSRISVLRQRHAGAAACREGSRNGIFF